MTCQVEAVHLLPVQTLPARESRLQRPAHLPYPRFGVVAVDEGGVRGAPVWPVPNWCASRPSERLPTDLMSTET
jgi:hypothetical protein